jgi:hypothetical protein
LGVKLTWRIYEYTLLTLLWRSANKCGTFYSSGGRSHQTFDRIASNAGGEFAIAGVACIDWSWMDDTDLHTACLTRDGVLLRLRINGKIVAEARSILYAPQPPQLFEVPRGYTPALAPEGVPGGLIVSVARRDDPTGG